MNAGVAFGRAWNLVPGVALTDAQMAQLTTDIVWLVEQTVTLPDGSTARVLVPQVYARVLPTDLTGEGTLMTGSSVTMRTTGDIINSGTIGGRTVVRLTGDNVSNLGGPHPGQRRVDQRANGHHQHRRGDPREQFG